MYNQVLDVSLCPASSVILCNTVRDLDDMDMDGTLDVAVWGSNTEGQNCLLPFLHNSNLSFAMAQLATMQETTNPFFISFGNNNGQKSVGLLAYMNGGRTFLKY